MENWFKLAKAECLLAASLEKTLRPCSSTKAESREPLKDFHLCSICSCIYFSSPWQGREEPLVLLGGWKPEGHSDVPEFV